MFFDMLQSWDTGQILLLPLRRKECWGFLRTKNPTASAGFEPANLGPEATGSNLPGRKLAVV